MLIAKANMSLGLLVLCTVAYANMNAPHPGLDAHWETEFPRIDTDHSSAISRDEIMAYLKTGHHLMTKAEKGEIIEDIKENVAKEFARLDKDKDGFLSAEERNAETKSKLRRSAKSKDKMSLDEYVIYKNPALNDDHSQYTRFLTEDVIDEWDKDSNGVLSYEEYDAWQAKSRDAIHEWEKTVDEEEGTFTISITTNDDIVETKKAEHDADFKGFDKNGDKSLDFQELLTYMESKGGAVWEAEADEFFMYVDANKSGDVDLQELQNAKYLNPVTTLHQLSILHRKHNEM